MRIGINLPNDLHRRLEPLKRYVNVSQICREAIEDRIRCYERALSSRSNEEIVRAIERAWEEEREMRAILEVDWGMLGCEDAESWVETAELKDWRYLRHRQEVIERQGRPRWEVVIPHLQGVTTFHERFNELEDRVSRQDDQFLDWLYDEHGGIDKAAAEREYMTAWLACTDSAWGLFLEKRGRYLEVRRRERLQSGSNRSSPTPPERLLRELEAEDES